MYTALYRAYRPETFETVLGQEHIVKILKNQIANDATGHAYLFCGTRGTGKTTSARLLAKGVNCLSEDGNRPCGECANCKSIKEGTFMDVVDTLRFHLAHGYYLPRYLKPRQFPLHP